MSLRLFHSQNKTAVSTGDPVGVVFNRTDAADWTAYAGGGTTTITNSGGGINFVSTNAGYTHYMELDAYGETMLSDVVIEFDVVYNSGSIIYPNVEINAARPLLANYSTLQMNGVPTFSTSGSLPFDYATTTHITVTIKNNTLKWQGVNGGNNRQVTGDAYPLTSIEHNVGKIRLGFPACNCTISNFKISITAPFGVDNLFVGDSVTWGFGVTNWADTWREKTATYKGETSALFAHGDTGMLKWMAAVQELKYVNPKKVWIMGSYVDTPAGLSTFQTRYSDFVDEVKTCSNLIKIYHLASYPNNFSEDIRPFNSWKSTTFNTGIDEYVDSYYATLEEAGGTGYNLIDSYDAGGSHLNQTGQDIHYNAIKDL